MLCGPNFYSYNILIRCIKKHPNKFDQLSTMSSSCSKVLNKNAGHREGRSHLFKFQCQKNFDKLANTKMNKNLKFKHSIYKNKVVTPK